MPLLKDEKIERAGKDKHVVDPDPHKIYSRKKERQGMSSEPDTDSNESAQFPSSG